MLIRCFGIAFVIFLLDQVSKWAVVEHVFKPHFGLGSLNFVEWYGSHLRLPFVQIEILPFFNFTMVWNEGIGLGLFGAMGPWFLIGLSLVICTVLIIWLYQSKDSYLVWPIGLMIGGAVGNMLDRSRYHAVVDFFDFHIGGWHYPVFNAADCAIVIGVFILLLQPIFTGKVKS